MARCVDYGQDRVCLFVPTSLESAIISRLVKRCAECPFYRGR